MSAPIQRVPGKAWVVTFAGTAINLCLGILYAWSVWKQALVAPKGSAKVAGSIMDGINHGWVYLSDAQATWAYALCGFIFALFMIPGGRIQDKYGPKVGATLGGLSLAFGCIIAGLMKSYAGLIVGFGILGGIGMGLGYAAATPAAVKWFGPHRRGLIVGLVVGGYGGAAIYISPVAKWLMAGYGISGSFIGLGIAFAVIVIVCGQLLFSPPAGYVPAGPPSSLKASSPSLATVDWSASEMLKTSQFYALVFMFFGSAQSGLLVIANAAPILNKTAAAVAFFAANAWIIASYGGLLNAGGRVMTGFYSDKIGRANAYLVNCSISAVCLVLAPSVIKSGNIFLLFVVLGIAYWQYGGGLALLPAFTADFFGPKNLGFNYGLVFLGWGLGFFVPQTAGYLVDYYKAAGDPDFGLSLAFYISAALLVLGVVVCKFIRRPLMEKEQDLLKQQPGGEAEPLRI